MLYCVVFFAVILFAMLLSFLISICCYAHCSFCHPFCCSCPCMLCWILLVFVCCHLSFLLLFVVVLGVCLFVVLFAVLFVVNFNHGSYRESCVTHLCVIGLALRLAPSYGKLHEYFVAFPALLWYSSMHYNSATYFRSLIFI